ncbi:hypothetical protein [Spodoptera cosmioides nucleopolyhedrovirus]|uniref:Uncharacterized protein n=1 Tax=Spodoptera cosmioides nucleopolyhedrovirus TaxID=2605774 RepID=A0A6B7KLE7_9ABAC|nr:hypothetical protein [Spodoptera cosmioides nucleopolyhedrovirus]
MYRMGILCLAIDSVSLDVRKIHRSVMRARSCMDFEVALPDLSDMMCSLKVVQYHVDYLIEYANKNLNRNDIAVNNMISEIITRDVTNMLINFTAKQNYDRHYNNIKTCQHIMRTNDNFKFHKFVSHMKTNNFDHIYTFVDLMNNCVSPLSQTFSYMMDRLFFLRRLCNKIDIHIREVDAIAALIYMQRQQQTQSRVVFQPPVPYPHSTIFPRHTRLQIDTIILDD